jgi:DNA-binding FrmR family transcriptional regulator
MPTVAAVRKHLAHLAEEVIIEEEDEETLRRRILDNSEEEDANELDIAFTDDDYSDW